MWTVTEETSLPRVGLAMNGIASRWLNGLMFAVMRRLWSPGTVSVSRGRGKETWDPRLGSGPKK